MLTVHIISLFPEVSEAYLRRSIPGRAIEKGIVRIYHYNPIDEVTALKRADDRPYGGGPGMVMRPEPLLKCYEKAKAFSGTEVTIFFTPNGGKFTRRKAKEYTEYDNMILFCGHYEGMDERVAEATNAERLSIGEYTLTGGELPALVVTDAVIRELPGVLGNRQSLEDTRVAGRAVYTRPESFTYNGREYTVPEVLLSGHHKNIDAYRSDTRKKEE